jgi:pimeloyl-ACP methyl ester carboxylesterase
MGSELTVTSGQAHLGATRAGQGAPVIFLHAGVADQRMWAAEMGAAARTHRAIAYDRRGFGRTAHAEEAYSQVGDLMTVLDALGASERAVLVGCSQGGRIAIDAALAHPHRIAGLVLIAPAISGAAQGDLPAAAQSLIAELDAAEDAGDLERVNALEARLWLDGPLEAAGRVKGAARDLFLDMNGIALRAEVKGAEQAPPSAVDRVGDIAVPTLVIWGDLDLPFLQARSRLLSQTIQGARGHEMAGVAHLPSLERPSEVAAMVDAFLNGPTT